MTACTCHLGHRRERASASARQTRSIITCLAWKRPLRTEGPPTQVPCTDRARQLAERRRRLHPWPVQGRPNWPISRAPADEPEEEPDTQRLDLRPLTAT